MKYLYELYYNRIMILSEIWYQNIKLNILICMISPPRRNAIITREDMKHEQTY